jgi:hypothetical protein
MLVVIASDWLHVDPIVRGLLATVTTFALLLAVEGASDGLAHRALPSSRRRGEPLGVEMRGTSSVLRGTSPGDGARSARCAALACAR